MLSVSPPAHEDTPTYAFAATQAHIERIARKREVLRSAQLDAEQQLLWSIAREWKAKRLTLAELVDAYYTYRVSADEIAGFAKRWDAIVPMKAVEVVAAKRRLEREAEQAAELQAEPVTGWFGAFPFGAEYVPPKGVNTVYVLFDSENRPCYVGSTGSLRHRLKAHAADGKNFTTWQARSCTDRAAAYALERQWLAAYLPYLNKRAS